MNIQDKFREPGQRISSAPALRKESFLRRHALMLFVLFAVLAAGGGYYYWNSLSNTSAEPTPTTAVRGDIEDVVTALGNLTPFTSVDVGAQVTGQLKKLSVAIGDEVKKDQLVAEIDAAVTSAKVDADNAQLQNYQAQLLQKESDLALTKAQADRQSRLMADNATSQDAFDVAQAAYNAAQAQLKVVQAQISQAQSTLKADQATLGYSKIYAPMTGTVTAIPAKEGQTLNANQQAPTILTIADLSTMTVSTQVSEADVPKLRLGMDAYFTTLGDPARRWTGKLRQILPTPTIVNNVVLYTALFDVENPNKVLMPQMSAQVFFIRGAAHDAVIVPVAALRFTGRNADGAARAGRQGGNGGGNGGQGRRGGGQRATDAGAGDRPRPATVTLLKPDGMTETREVTVGVTDRVNAQIISGLEEGETIVASNAPAAGGRAQRGANGNANALGAPPNGGRGLGGFR
jgi:macrolide-specific efflux system membrane fusion protein